MPPSHPCSHCLRITDGRRVSFGHGGRWGGSVLTLTATPCPAGPCWHPEPRVMGAVGQRIPGAGIGPHTFSPVQALSTQGSGPGCWAVAAPCAQRRSRDALVWPHAQLLVQSAALGVEQRCVTALLHSTLPCPSQLLSCPGSQQPLLPGASSRGISGTPFPLVLLRALSSIALRWDTVVLLGSSCAREVSLTGG